MSKEPEPTETRLETLLKRALVRLIGRQRGEDDLTRQAEQVIHIVRRDASEQADG